MPFRRDNAESRCVIINWLRSDRKTWSMQIPCGDHLCIKLSWLLTFVAGEFAAGTLVNIAVGERQIAGKGDETINEAHGGDSLARGNLVFRSVGAEGLAIKVM